jgi:trk system potassium uptake protein TrkH
MSEDQPTPSHGRRSGGPESGSSRPDDQEQPYLVKISTARPKDLTLSILGDPEFPLDTTPSSRASRRISLYQGPWALMIGFALIIFLGGVLLKLPWAAAPGVHISWGEALFTSTSAATVTGLVVLNTASDFSFFGQVIILLLLQVGGVGFIAFSVLLFRLIGRSINLQTRLIVQQSLGTRQASGVLRLALYVLGITLLLEAIGALLLWLRWRTALPDGEALWYAIFHAISSYCNAGFDLFSGTENPVLFGFGTDWYTLIVMGTLILLGGFGITVLYDMWNYPGYRFLGLNTRFSLLMAAILTVLGLGVFLIDPLFHSIVFAGIPVDQRIGAALFSVISSRTAGLTILPLAELSEATQMIIMLWMFIGGAPASMAGGVSTSTVAVLLTAVVATARGMDESVSFRRTVPVETIAKAVAIMTVSTLLVVVVTLLLSLRQEGEIFTVAFEVISAFANAGYSLDFTGELDNFGRFLIAFTMYWGRLGPLTIVVALAQRRHPSFVHYPEEPIILG